KCKNVQNEWVVRYERLLDRGGKPFLNNELDHIVGWSFPRQYFYTVGHDYVIHTCAEREVDSRFDSIFDFTATETAVTIVVFDGAEVGIQQCVNPIVMPLVGFAFFVVGERNGVRRALTKPDQPVVAASMPRSTVVGE